MSVSIKALADELKELTAWQPTPEPITDRQYHNMIIRGIKRLFIDTNNGVGDYSEELFYTQDDELHMNINLDVKEERYVLLCAQIEFFKRVQLDVNTIMSYTTNALTVANADKPYANLKDTIGNLETERRITYYKMVPYTLGE